MKSLNKNIGLASMALILAVSFYSCSSRITSQTSIKKMEYAQAMEKSRAQAQKTAYIPVEQAKVNSTVAITNPEQVSEQKSLPAIVKPDHKKQGTFAQIIPKKAATI